MALWCRDLKTVTVARSDVARSFTLVVPYYESPIFFARQLAHWKSLPNLRQLMKVIVVDDGSPDSPASDVLRHEIRPTFLRVFRIDQDVRWNWLAARNIGAHHADEGWLVLTDMDHVVPEETIHAIVYGVYRPDTVYAFQRREHTGDVIAPHSASFLMTRAMFWTIGGYDERLSGFYGTDGPFRKRIAAVARMAILPEFLERHEYVEDASTSRYQRKQPEDAQVRQLIQRFHGTPPKVLSFAYREVTPC